MDTLLLVDDVPANIKVLIEALDDVYEIIIATNGERALRWAESDHPPDLILLDIMMPEMDGYEVCRRLKANPQTKDIPIIFVTAMYEEEDEQRGLELGAVDYVHKPYSLAIIKVRIATQLALKKQRDALTAAEKRLQEANDLLEQRVEERTAALMKSNSKLVEEVFEHKKTAKRLEKAKVAANQASQAKRDFLDNMSHEIRTPINGIVGFTSLLACQDLPARPRSYVEMISTSTERLLSTVNKILDFAKIEAEELELVGQIFSLQQLVERSLGKVHSKAEKKGLALKIQVDPTLPNALIGDPIRLQQVLTCLLENGIKFSQKGQVQLTVSPYKRLDRGVLTHFQVIDTGVGIHPSKQRQIFAAFGQADTSNTRQYEGTGLGLTIAALLVEMMDGRIWVDSQPGRGSTFHVTVALDLPGPDANLPVWQGEEAHPADTLTVETKLQDQSSHHILLAEDERVNRQLLHDLLEEMGWQVTAVANGQQAVEAFQRGGIDVILMDIQMPVMSGHEATRLIRKQEEEQGGHVPIIAVTAHALDGDREKCLAAGMDAYIPKPVKTKELLEQVKSYLPRQ